MKKRALKILATVYLVLFAALAAAAYIGYRAISSDKLKDNLASMISGAINRDVTIDRLSVKFPPGIGLADAAVFEKAAPSQKMLTAREISVTLKLLPLIFKKTLHVSSIYFRDLEIFPGPGRTFHSKGDAAVRGKILLPLSEPEKVDYDIILSLTGQHIEHMPIVGDISPLEGRIKIVPDNIGIVKLNGLSYGCPIIYEGALTNFKDPYLVLTETIDMDLSKLHSFLSKRVSRAIRQVSFSGQSKVVLTMYGKFSEWPLKLKGAADITNGGINVPALKKPIENINTSLTFDENKLELPKLTAEYNKQAYRVAGVIEDFSAPSVDIALSSQDLDFRMKFDTFDNLVRFESIAGMLFNSSINIVGRLEDFKKPNLKLSGDLDINLEDLRRATLKFVGEHKAMLSFLDTVKPKGICSASLFLDGPAANIRFAELAVKSASGEMWLYGLNMGAFNMNMQMKDRIISIPTFTFMPYGGMLSAGAVIDYMGGRPTPAPDYKIEINSSGIQLSELIKDTEIENKNVSGALNLNCVLEGHGYDTADLTGRGALSVADGHLLEFPILGRIADIIRLPALRQVAVKEAAGNFIIMNKKVTTQDLAFSSDQLYMLSRGSLSFDGGLDFDVSLSLAPKSMHQDNRFSVLTDLIADETGRLAGAVKITGTLKEPKYKFVPLGLDKILPGKILEGFKKLLQKD